MVTSDQAARAPLSRRQFLIGVGGAVGAAATGAAAFEVMRLANPAVRPSLRAHPVPAAGPVRIFHSRPDLRPPTISLNRPSSVDPGYLFLGPWASGGDQPGPLIVDGGAEPVWFEHVSSLWETNFRPYM